MNKISLVIVTIIIVALVAMIAFVVVKEERGMQPAMNGSTATSTPVTYAQVLAETKQDNPAFASALVSEGKGDYATALSDLQNALTTANDPLQQELIQLRIAEDGALTQNYRSTVPQFLQIAGDTSDLSTIRAYAVEGLGIMYERTQDPAVTSQIFSQEPFKSLYVSTSTNISYRHLFQYATTLSPLPLSEFYVASSYAYGLARHDIVSTSTSPTVASLVQQLNASFNAGNIALASLKTIASSSPYTLESEEIRAVALGRMQLIGDTGFGDPEQAYESVLSAYAAAGVSTTDGLVRLDYASFLARSYGAARSSDIQSILAPIYTEPSHGGPLTESYLKAFAGTPLTVTKVNVILLSTFDPKFKAFLGSLGWTNSDFSTSTPVTQ